MRRPDERIRRTTLLRSSGPAAEGTGMARAEVIPAERIERAILRIRGPKGMLDRDRAPLDGVTTFHHNKAVQRNREGDNGSGVVALRLSYPGSNGSTPTAAAAFFSGKSSVASGRPRRRASSR